jgi:hypothetical protein
LAECSNVKNLSEQASPLKRQKWTVELEHPMRVCDFREKNRAPNFMNSAELYLTLLKRVLTNTLYNSEPTGDSSSQRYIVDFTRHYIRGPALSMLPIARMDQLHTAIFDILTRDVPGDLIEAGVWRGGATILMRALLEAYQDPGRNVWIADSFQGLPEPDGDRFPVELAAHQSPVLKDAYERFAVTLAEVQDNFRTFGLLDDRVRFLPGWFKDTLPSAPIAQLALMRLDADYYESTMDCLTYLYDKLSVGGYVIIDDYGEDSWTYCRRAVDDFRARRNITAPLIAVDTKCFWWIKE